MPDERMVEKTRTWADNWNNIIRYVLFRDEKLRTLMLVPERANVIDFVANYFIEGENPDELITDEKVRIICYDSAGGTLRNPNVKFHYKEMDIYVKDDAVYNTTSDRLQKRYHLIADRLKYLLLREKHIQHMSFRFENEYNLWTKVVGYKRYHITFSYKTTV